MQTSEFMQFLRENSMPVLTLNDAVKILHSSKGYARLFLHRCFSRGLLGRAERGVYYSEARSNEYEIASHIVNPSYVSMVSALTYYGLTTQIPHIVYVVSPKRHRQIRGVLGFDLVFRKIKPSMMFGYHKEQDGNVLIADPEKAIVDIYYFNDVNDLDPGALDRPSRVDLEKLVLYAKRSGEGSVIRGVSNLLKEHGYGEQSSKLESGPAAGV